MLRAPHADARQAVARPAERLRFSTPSSSLAGTTESSTPRPRAWRFSAAIQLHAFGAILDAADRFAQRCNLALDVKFRIAGGVVVRL